MLKEIKERFNAFIMTKGLRRTRQREVIVEAAYIHSRLTEGPLAGQIGGVQVTAGYSVGL